MNVAYTIIAKAIHTESSVFVSDLIIVYDAIRIDTSTDVQKLIALFQNHKLTDNDLRNIIYIYVSIKGSSNTHTQNALEYIKSLTDQARVTSLKTKIHKRNQKYLALKQKNIDLKLREIELQQQVTLLLQLCAGADNKRQKLNQ